MFVSNVSPTLSPNLPHNSREGTWEVPAFRSLEVNFWGFFSLLGIPLAEAQVAQAPLTCSPLFSALLLPPLPVFFVSRPLASTCWVGDLRLSDGPWVHPAVEESHSWGQLPRVHIDRG